MFILNWFWDVLAQLGTSVHALYIPRPELTEVWNSGLMHKNAKILFLGLDNAGKTVRLWYEYLGRSLILRYLADTAAHAQKRQACHIATHPSSK